MTCSKKELLKICHILFPLDKIRNEQSALSLLQLQHFDRASIKDAAVKKLVPYGSEFITRLYGLAQKSSSECLKNIIAEILAASITNDLKKIEPEQHSRPQEQPIPIENLPVVKTESGYILNLDKILPFFLKSTTIIPDFEVRAEQFDMLSRVAQSVNSGTFTVIEAGTGVGKSMAYLFPLAVWGLANNEEKIVISTNTKGLQEQLIKKDIPLIQQMLGINFDFCILKGRNNYICKRRFFNYINSDELKENRDIEAILNLFVWQTMSKTGDRSENLGFSYEFNDKYGLWSDVNSISYYCLGNACPFFNSCFLFGARRKAKKAKIIVVNHSLLFSDLVHDNSIIPPYSTIVCDEAHKIEEQATHALAYEFSFFRAARVFNRLYRRPFRSKKEFGLLMRLFFKLNKKKMSLPQSTVNAIFDIIRDFKEKTIYFLDFLRTALKNYGKASFAEGKFTTKKRILKQITTDTNSLYSIDELRMIGIILKDIIPNFLKLRELLKKVPQYIIPDIDEIAKDLEGVESEVYELLNDYQFIFEKYDENYVYWVEKVYKEDYGIFAAPINIAQFLKDNFYSRLNSAVFCSATLTADNNFSFFNRSIGLNLVKNIVQIRLGSSFDYVTNVTVAVPVFIKSPKEPGFYDEILEIIGKIVDRTRGRTLALFTSIAQLRNTRNFLKERFSDDEVKVLAQGMDGMSYMLIEEFKEVMQNNIVLLGVDTFWEGIDVPGEALSYLIITRLPFGVPDDPILQAKREEFEKRGENPFYNFDLPRAVIRLKQGFGRLIRKKSDRGVVFILDNRILTMGYGAKFRRSLPVPESEYDIITNTEQMLYFLKGINA